MTETASVQLDERTVRELTLGLQEALFPPLGTAPIRATAAVAFSDGWPTAKGIIELIRDTTKNPFVKLGLNAAIAGGEAIYRTKCPI